MRRLALIFSALITLHAPSGKEIFVNPDEIMIVREGGPPFDARHCKTEVVVHDREVCVRETPDTVKRLRDGE